MSEQQVEVVFEEDSDGGASRRAHGGGGDGGEGARQRLAQARTQRQAEIHECEKAVLTARSEAQAAEHEYALAAEIGDFKKQAEVQRKIARAEAVITAGEARQAYLQQAAVSSGDVFEDHLSKFTPLTAQWMRSHRDWVEDPHKNSKLIGAHHFAISEGHQPDSPEYFAHVERTLNIRGGGGSDHGGGELRGRGGSSSGGNTVRLSKGEAERATDGSIVWNKGNIDHKTGEPIREGDPRIGKPIGVEAYGYRKHALERQGAYNKL